LTRENSHAGKELAQVPVIQVDDPAAGAEP
jgi:hypothetical protein